MNKVEKYQKDATPRNPWHFAKVEGRDYLTPEDVGEGIKAGCLPVTALKVVCEAVEAKAAEDPSLCAFVALEFFRKYEAR